MLSWRAQHGCLRQRGSGPTAEQVFSSPAHFVKDKAGYESADFRNAYQIYPFVTGQFITTRYLIFNSVTQECKLMWSAILLIITVGEQMGPCICKYLISHIVVVCLWKYPVWLWNHTACFGLYNDVCCRDSCIRRISPSVLIILHHSAQFWALNLASQWNTVTATHNCLFLQFSIL